MRGLLHGDVVVVSGGGSGLGRETVLAAARAAATVVAVGRNRDRLSSLERHAAKEGFEVRVEVADLVDPDSVQQMVTRVLRDHGRIDGLANFAGEWVQGAAAETPHAAWRRCFDENVMTAVNLVSAMVPRMAARGRGAIVNVGSILSSQPVAGAAAYCSAKAAVLMFTRSLAVDYGAQGIRANCLCPGLVRTPMTEGLFEDSSWVEHETARYPLGRIGTPADVAKAAVFLLSTRSNGISGAMLPVDGGWLAGL